MTVMDINHARTDGDGERRIEDVPVEDRPPCPTCCAPPELQSTSDRRQDGALELVVLVCSTCGADHPIWF